jgi:death-on-curing protein
VIYLSAEQVLFLHDRLIEETGGEHGVRDLGGLESALARPQAAFGDTEFYPDTAVLFLQVNGYRLTATNPELERFAIYVTTLKPSIDTIADWFRTKTVRTKSR